MAIHPGEAVTIGLTVVMVQPDLGDPPPRRIRSHAALEQRLADECARAAATGARFALVRLGLAAPQPWARVLPILAQALPPPHLLAAYGPQDYEALLVAEDAAAVEGRLGRLLAALAEAGLPGWAGVSWFPDAGATGPALLAAANAALRRARGAAQLEPPPMAEGALGGLAARAAARRSPIVILGEAGTGKGLLARSVHRLSLRAAGPFLAASCAGAKGSLERAIFGLEGPDPAGGAPGPGLLERADGGTLLLEAIDGLPAPLQARLARVLEAREVTRTGGQRPRSIDVRLIATSSGDLERAVARGTFRGDLFYRLAGLALTVPPLRERVAELPALVAGILRAASRAHGRQPPRISVEAMRWLETHRWPGNVRELENVLDRALALCDGDVIEVDHLPGERLEPGPSAPRPGLGGERDWILRALQACAWNQSRAAERLGIARRTLVSRLDGFGIPRPQKRLGAGSA